MAQSDKFIAHYSYHYFLLDVLIPVFSEAGRSVFPSLLQASSHPPNKFFSLLKSELISVACHIVLTGRAHRPSLLCRVAHSVWIQKLSHTIWMLEFSLSPLSFCFLMASAASKWKSVCPGQCQGPLLCLEHPVSSQKKKKSLIYLSGLQPSSMSFYKALLGSLGMPFPSAILEAVASSLEEIYLLLRAAMTYSPTRGPSLRPSLKGEQREPKWDTSLFALSKDEIGSGVSHGLSIMGETFQMKHHS